MIQRAILLAAALTMTSVSAWASPFDDLASPSPDVRTDAADQIREQHLNPPVSRKHWNRIFAIIDMSKPHSLDRLVSRLPPDLRGYPITRDEFSLDGVFVLPLDHFWCIVCTMREGELVAFEVDPRVIEVSPPPGYNGFWRTYRIDGTVAHLYDYQNGRNLGDERHMSP